MAIRKTLISLLTLLSTQNLIRCPFADPGAYAALTRFETPFQAENEPITHVLESPILREASPFSPKLVNPLEVSLAPAKSPRFLVEKENVPFLDIEKTVEMFSKAKSPFLALDYDGTLTSIIKDADKAVPSKALKEAFKRLNSKKSVTTAIVSGRTREFLDLHFKQFDNFILCAEHGAFYKLPGEDWVQKFPPEVNGVDWRESFQESISKFVEDNKDSYPEPKESAMTWHYQKAADIEAAREKVPMYMKELQKLAEEKHKAGVPKLSVTSGNNIIEITFEDLNKGNMLLQLLRQKRQTDFILCLGDDTSDEKMFEVLRKKANGLNSEAIQTARVNIEDGKSTGAKSQIQEVQTVVNLLRRFAGLPEKSILPRSSRKLIS